MVLRTFLLGASLAVLLAGCSSDDLARTTETSQAAKVTIAAGLHEGTRVSFTPEPGVAEKLKVAWESSDALFAIAAGT